MSNAMNISVIIPTYNEEANILHLLNYLIQYSDERLREIIIVDGNSKDNTCAIAEEAGVIVIRSGEKSRASQMNHGARRAKGEILYFLHCDTIPPKSFVSEICSAVSADKPAGCFSYHFDSDKPLLKINSFFTRYNGIFCGGGDQSLYIQRRLFWLLKGFNEKYVLMEDFELTGRIKKYAGGIHLIRQDMSVSARKYYTNSYLRVSFANVLVFILYKMGVPSGKLSLIYRKCLRPLDTDTKSNLSNQTEMAI